jgi:putative nucleotidyltransferase with HDIG domain
MIVKIKLYQRARERLYAMSSEQTLSIDQLQVGHYIHLDMKWFEHPFAFSHFKIKSQAQIETLRGLGLAGVRFSADLSDVRPALAANAPAPGPAAATVASVAADVSSNMLAKRAMMEKMQVRRQNAERIEKAFINTASTIRDLEKNLYSRPQETAQQATALISEIANSILIAPELAIHVMGDKMGGEELYFHSLNVTMLSIMMARDLKLPLELVSMLGVGALLHDVGRKDVPDKVLKKTEPLTQAERHFYEMHCQYGVDMGQRLKLAPAVLTIIGSHHELFDGSGYPSKLKGDAISLLARIVVIANYYDELCNPLLIADALTPHEALSLMFAKLRGKFDPTLLQVFIRCLGVYPPGTIVQLSNGSVGMVATVNTARPMKPTVVIYDPDVPKQEAILLDMERETDFNITKAIRPGQVPREVYNYLSPRKRVSYYFDASSSEAGKP